MNLLSAHHRVRCDEVRFLSLDWKRTVEMMGLRGCGGICDGDCDCITLLRISCWLIYFRMGEWSRLGRHS